MAYSTTNNQSDDESVQIVNDCISDWDTAFSPNVKAFKAAMRTNFENPMDVSTARALKQSNIAPFTCNTLEPFISRLIGDFSFADMGVEVTPADVSAEDSPQANDPAQQIPQLMMAIFEQIYYRSDSDTVQTQLYKHVLGGGYGVMRVLTEYVSDSSFSTQPKIESVPNPTLCGFDPNARLIHKGDGDYCFEFVPYTYDDFFDEFGVDPSTLSFPTIGDANSAFSWTTASDNSKVYYVCDYYCKKRKSFNIYRTPLGNMSASDWNKLRDEADGTGTPQVFPDIKTFPSRRTQIETIVRYKVAGGKLLDTQKTPLKYLPLVFFDGNSITIDQKQQTRSYTHNVQQAQKVKDILWSKATDLLMKQGRSKLIASVSSIPSEASLRVPWENPSQDYSAYVYNDYDDQNRPVNPPTFLPPEPISQELLAAKSEADELIQRGLGSYDAQQGNIGASQLSGKAILAGATQSNSAAKPYIINFVSCFRQVIDILVDLIPGCYKELQQFSTTNSSGNVQTIQMNAPGQIQASDLAPNKLNVYVRFGGSFEAQRQNAMQQLTQLAASNQGLQQLLSGVALPDLLENLDIGANKSIIIAKAQEQVEQSQNQPPQPPNPQVINAQAAMMRAQTEQQQTQNEFAIAQANLALKQQEVNVKAMGVHGKVQTETARTQIKAADSMHDAAANMEQSNAENRKYVQPTMDSVLDYKEAVMNRE